MGNKFNNARLKGLKGIKMTYVYKVIGRFDDDNFYSQLNKLSSKFSFIYTNKTLFLALRNWNERQEGAELLKKVFRPIRDYYIEEMNEKNLTTESDYLKDWCVQNIIRIETQRYEEENQDKLKAAWYALDKMEEELQQIVNSKEENNGKEVENNGEETGC